LIIINRTKARGLIMILTQTRKNDFFLKENKQSQLLQADRNQAIIRNYRGKLQWTGNLDEMRIDKQ